MAQVPYQGGTADVQPDARPPDDYLHVDASPAAFGGAIGQGLEKAGQGALELGKFWGQVQTDDVLNKALPQLDENLTKFRALEGQAALDAQGDYDKTSQKILDDAKAQLQTPQQQLDFERAATSYAQRLRMVAGTHVVDQTKAVVKSTNDTARTLAINHAATFWDQPDMLSAAIGDATAAGIKNLHDRGLDTPQAREEESNKAKADAAKAAAEVAMSINPDKALKILDAFKGPLGAEYGQLRTRAEEAQNRKGGLALNEEAAGAVRSGWRGQSPTSSTVPANWSDGITPLRDSSGPVRIDGLHDTVKRGLYNLRQSFGPLSITSSDAGGHAEGSEHYAENAVDLSIAGMDQPTIGRLIDNARAAGFTGFGIGSTHLHLDMRPSPGGAPVVFGDSYSGPVNGLDVEGWRARLAGREVASPPAVAAAAPGSPPAAALPAAPGIVSEATPQPAAFNPGEAARPAPPTARTEDTPESLYAQRVQYIEQSDKPETVKKVALAWAAENYRAAAIAAQATEKEKNERASQAAADYTKQLLTGKFSPDIYRQIAEDPRLKDNGPAMEHLVEFVSRWTGKEPTASFGKDWQKMRDDMLSAPGSPDHIGYDNFQEVYRRSAAGADITPRGIENLYKMRAQNATDLNTRSWEIRATAAMNSAKKYLTFDGEGSAPGFEGLKDPDGPHAVDQFTQEFMGEYADLLDKAKETGDTKALKEFLSEKNIKEMAQGVRSQRKLDAAKMQAGAYVPEPPNTPLPPPPPNIDMKGWQDVLSRVPVDAAGQAWSHKGYAAAINWLLKEPTAANIAAWDNFMPKEIPAAAVLDRLTRARRDRLDDEAIPLQLDQQTRDEEDRKFDEMLQSIPGRVSKHLPKVFGIFNPLPPKE